MAGASIAPNRSPDQNSVPGLPLRDLTGFTHRWVDAEGIRLNAVEGGLSSGPTVVLLAGFPQTWWAWHKAIPRLAQRFHLNATCRDRATPIVPKGATTLTPSLRASKPALRGSW
jgi:hypothetical protein